MKTYIFSFIFSSLFINAIAMEISDVTFIQANLDNAPDIVQLINEQAINDNTKIVILPKKFRTMATENAIKEGRIYCAKKTNSDDIIAFKKLYIINKSEEYEDIAANEIRCSGPKSILVNEIPHGMPRFSFKNSFLIYFGGDYTAPAYRNRGINSHLTRHAFESIKKSAIESIHNNNLENIVLLYGLTKANAGETADSIDRTPSIKRAFMPFAQNVASANNYKHIDTIYHSRYEAFMPTFDPENIECIPKADDKAIPGYGNILLFPLIK